MTLDELAARFDEARDIAGRRELAIVLVDVLRSTLIERSPIFFPGAAWRLTRTIEEEARAVLAEPQSTLRAAAVAVRQDLIWAVQRLDADPPQEVMVARALEHDGPGPRVLVAWGRALAAMRAFAAALGVVAEGAVLGLAALRVQLRAAEVGLEEARVLVRFATEV